MKKNSKVLKFKKSRIANLDAFILKGGNDRCLESVTSCPPPTVAHDCITTGNIDCTQTQGQPKTDLELTCTENVYIFTDGM